MREREEIENKSKTGTMIESCERPKQEVKPRMGIQIRLI